MKNLKILFIIFILVVSLIMSLNKFIFIKEKSNTNNINSTLEAQKSTEAIITIQGKEYHLYDPSNIETITENGKNYIRVNSYIYQINNRTLGFEIILGFLIALLSVLIFHIYF